MVGMYLGLTCVHLFFQDLSANSTDADVRKLADIGLEGYK